MSGAPVSGGEGARVLSVGEIRFDERGLVPVIAQDSETGDVLMLAYANDEALRLTIESGRAHYYSRSRNELWRKGDTSGNVQHVTEVMLDCDGDAVLYRLRQTGPACHTGARSCFFRSEAVGEASDSSVGANLATGGPTSEAGKSADRALELLDQVVRQRLHELPEASYVTRLHQRGIGYVSQKVVEEAGETVVAALQQQDEELLSEASDLLFHLTVLLHERGQSLSAVADLLEERHRSRRS